jgi:hypothetical protein
MRQIVFRAKYYLESIYLHSKTSPSIDNGSFWIFEKIYLITLTLRKNVPFGKLIS